MKLLLFLLLICGFVQVVDAQNQAVKGKYQAYVGDTILAEETYSSQKTADGAIRTDSEVTVNGNVTKFVTTTRKNLPVDFFIEANGKQVLKANFAAGEAKVLVAEQPEKTIKTAATVILENGVWSQYLDLLTQYDRAKNGVQKFVGFLPTQTLNLNLTVEKTGTQNLKSDEKDSPKNLSVEKYVLRAEIGLVVEILADTTGVPLLIEIPSQQVKVVRQGFEFLRVAPKTFDGAFTSEDVSFQNGAVKLAGTLTLPKNVKSPFPAAIIITGSGRQDRDGSALNNLYKQIAEGLSRAGIGVLRVDDRGNGKSVMLAGTETSYRDLIADSRAAFDYLTTRQEVDRNKIIYVGHSEGAETALTLAAEDKRVAAIVILAGSSRPVNEVVFEQELYQRALRETVNAADKTKIMPVAQNLIKLFEAAQLPENASNPKLAWFREHLNSNPSLLAAKVACPVLIVQGERDAQVLPAHAVALAQAFATGGNKNVSLRILPNLTHLFTPIDSTAVSTDLIQTLQNWTNANLLVKP